MKRSFIPCVSLWLAGLIGAAAIHADVVTDWNDVALPLVSQAGSADITRQFALVHVAQFEAVNSVVGKYTPYVVNLAAPGASWWYSHSQAAPKTVKLCGASLMCW
jgi:hypothetical protein